ncbi:hypothetical protein [Paraburkholderia sp. MM6662-R1]|uniref:hypothetical protein n=1 Tax=Paraburkholderia sp. MM6662-R1 TaxID=2991066 RepID=UPI003D25E76F
MLEYPAVRQGILRLDPRLDRGGPVIDDASAEVLEILDNRPPIDRAAPIITERYRIVWPLPV